MKYAICNETFAEWDHSRVCNRIAELGYTGLEVAPFTLASRITDVSAARRSELRQQAEAAGVQIIGLHWLLAKTEGFHLTSTDPAVRKRTGEYFAELATAAADMGGAKAVGMRTVWKLNGRYDQPPCADADFTIHDLAELLALPVIPGRARQVMATESRPPHHDNNEDRY